MKEQWILASASPRRRELLERLGIEFQVIPAKREEKITKTRPEEVVMELARQKAAEVAEGFFDAPYLQVILGADTVVSFQGQILGKPKDEDDAFRMLSLLSGQTHQVYTGVTVILGSGGKFHMHTFYECTDVTMYPMSSEEIRRYIATKDPMDKAGSYGIQSLGGIYVKEIRGDYNNVVGLPLARLYQELKKLVPAFS